MAPFGLPAVTPPAPTLIENVVQIPATDNTECNYLVFFFVAGLFLLSLNSRKA